MMMTHETTQLQRAWQAKGNPPCLHPATEREYYASPNGGEATHPTGDDVCTTCGACFYPGHTLEEDRRQRRARLEGEDDDPQRM